MYHRYVFNTIIGAFENVALIQLSPFVSRLSDHLLNVQRTCFSYQSLDEAVTLPLRPLATARKNLREMQFRQKLYLRLFLEKAWGWWA